MKNSIILLFLLLTSGILKAQICGNDSVVVQYKNDRNHYNTTITFVVDSFDLINGVKYQSSSPLPGNTNYSPASFTRPLISYNSNNDTIEFYTLLGSGTGSGYSNGSKIEFSYNAANQIVSRTSFTGSGNSWTQNIVESYTYDASDRITSYVSTDTTGDISEKLYLYNGQQATSIIYRDSSGGVMLNKERYLFSYDSIGIRDSVFLQRWDSNLLNWQDSLQSAYDNTDYTAKLSRTDSIGSSGVIIREYYLDTLNNILKTYRPNYLGSGEETVSFGYVKSRLKIIGTSSFYGTGNSSTIYKYNSIGILIRVSNSSGGSMASSGSTTQYDSLGHPTNWNYWSSSGVSDSDRSIDYYYSSADSISFNYLPLMQIFCQGDSVQTFPIVNGGCGPYTFSWSPSIGLSSDSIANPLICVGDTVNYTVTVTDSSGHSSYTNLLVSAYLMVFITFDSTLCSGCPVVLSASANISGLGLNGIQWFRNDTLIPAANGFSYVATGSGSYRVKFIANFCSAISDPVQLSLSGLTRVNGRLYLDIDSNCTFNTNDRPLYMDGSGTYFLKISRQNYTVNILPDSNGYYDIPIDTGTFNFSIQNPTAINFPACPDSNIITVSVPAFGDTLNNIDLVLKPLPNCRRLSVNMTSSNLRSCAPFILYVKYFNEGSLDEPNPVVNVQLPSELDSISSSLPFSLLPGNIYSFALPPLAIGAHGQFQIHGIVHCDPAGLLNATLCMSAEINSDFCSLLPDSTWDGSNIRVFSECQGGSVCFRILNDAESATGHMNSVSTWRLYADNNLVQQGSFILNAYNDTTLCFPSDGRTFRLEADQLSGFPINSQPNASIERCGQLQAGHFYSLNQLLNRPLDNSLPFNYTYCRTIRGSYDPNSKSAIPIGVATNNFIDHDQRIIYRINFQNTGTDTAFKVVIVDELSSFLDLSTINLISSSHTYSFSVTDNILTWTFDPILLPDSNINEPASNGFLEFSIKPLAGIPDGTGINNRAKIYFDWNQPIYTSFTNHEICDVKAAEIHIYPLTTFCAGQSMTFKADILHGGSVPNVSWYRNGVQEFQVNDTVSFSSMTWGDTIQVRLTSNYLCAIPNLVWSEMYIVTDTIPLITYSTPSLVSPPALSYQWYLDGNPILGAVSQTYLPLVNGLYQVAISDSSGCITFTSDYNFLLALVKDYNLEISVYPNPTNEYLFVKSLPGLNEVLLSDMAGKVIHYAVRNFRTDELFSLETKTLVSGIYFLKISNKQGAFYRLVTIEH